jgi:hypothetical protein
MPWLDQLRNGSFASQYDRITAKELTSLDIDPTALIPITSGDQFRVHVFGVAKTIDEIRISFVPVVQ